MTWFKRISLFLITNILIMVTLTLVINLLGIRPYIDASGLNIPALLVFCAAWGMGGAFISLLMSKQMAKWFMSVQIIDPRNPGQYGELLNTVKVLSTGAGIPMPEVGVYESPEVNAFATGPSRSRSLVAVSTGLLQRMDRNEADGVLGHEISHIANGDMVTMTLVSGVVNAFAMFLSRIISYVASLAVDERYQGIVRLVSVIFFDILFSILGSLVVAAFSRHREFKADAGGARLAGRNNMIAALEKLRRTYELGIDDTAPSMAAMKISGSPKWLQAFSTHPPLEVRIEALKKASIAA
jgi:heat shock protein HtpX